MADRLLLWDLVVAGFLCLSGRQGTTCGILEMERFVKIFQIRLIFKQTAGFTPTLDIGVFRSAAKSPTTGASRRGHELRSNRSRRLNPAVTSALPASFT